MFDEPAIKLVCERLTVFGSEVGRAVNSLAAAAKLIANVPHRQSLTNVARGIKSTSWINSFSAFCDFGGPIKSNVIYQLMTAGLVRDSQPFCEARFSCQELIRFLGIALDWATAAPLARMAAHRRSRVERWRGGLGGAYLLPALSFAGASLAQPCSVSTSRSSNRTCRFPASGFRTRNHA